MRIYMVHIRQFWAIIFILKELLNLFSYWTLHVQNNFLVLIGIQMYTIFMLVFKGNEL